MSSSSKSRAGSRSAYGVAVLLLVAAGAGPAALAQPERRDEIRVTIGFLLNFAKFTEWPDRPAEPSKEFCVAVVGDDLLADTMQKLTAGRTVRGLAISVIKVKSADEVRTCHMAFFGNEVRRTGTHLVLLKNQSILTVSTEKGFLAQGGMIELFVQDNRMRFSINRNAADAANLRISAELQELASPR